MTNGPAGDRGDVMADAHNAVALVVVLIVLLLLSLAGCGSEQSTSEGNTAPAQIAIVFNQQQAGQLAALIAEIARVDVTISGPDLATPRTASVAVANLSSGREIPVTINAPVGENRTVAVRTFDGGNRMLFSGSRSGVTLPSAAPILIEVALAITVTVQKQGSGNGTVTSSPPGIDCGGTCSTQFDAGTAVALTAAAEAGSSFGGWSGAGCSGTGGCTVTGNATVTAVFTTAVSTARVTVTKSGTGAGIVTSSPSGISCGGGCSANFTSGSTVVLTATPSGGSTFTGWSGACSGSGSCTVILNGDQTVNAEFTAAPATALLTVNKTGNGTVASNPAGINCGDTCGANFASGSTVTLTATATGGSTFTGWGGACSGTGSCAVVMNGNQTVTATFTPPPSTNQLTVNKIGTGAGTVTSTPVGISCGNSCSVSFPTGSMVTLNAAADAGSIFVGWSGGCGGTGSCSVVMNGDQTVTAEFAAAPSVATLTVIKAGAGSGTVSSAPAGINGCADSCSAGFTSGSSVTLTATPTGGSTFAEWGGACSGTESCVVVMNGNQTVTATFTPPPSTNTLTVNRTGSGTGTVSSAPAGIDCGGTCSAGFPTGSSVTLTAAPAAGSMFAGWSGGGCSGTGTCVTVMSGDQTVVAQFALNPDVVTLSVTKSGPGGGTVTSAPTGIDCGGTCAFGFARGTTVTLTAVPDGNSDFAGWNGSGCGGSDACVLTMDDNRSIDARFDED